MSSSITSGPSLLGASVPKPDLEVALALVESALSALGEALRSRNSDAIERHSSELHRSLAKAVDHFSRAAHSGGVPQALRHRLANAGGQVAAQRESLARATAALDRAIDVLMPRASGDGLYSSLGAAERGGRGSGTLQA